MDAIIIAARLESERLPQKHLQVVEGLPLIKWLTERIKTHFADKILQGLKIIIATPDTKLNTKFDDLYTKDVVEIFHGNEKNIPLRIKECSKNYCLQNVVIADGDNFLLSMEALSQVLDALQKNKMAKTEGLPLGMNTMGWKTSYLDEVLVNKKIELLETGWGRIFNEKDITKLKFDFSGLQQFNMLRFTTDYPQDLEFMKAMFKILKNNALYFSSANIIDTCVLNKIYTINGDLSQIYFDNFYKKMNEEKIMNGEINY